MKQILCIFTLCILLALGFTACQTEDPLTLEQQQLEMKKRDSKKHPKLEYITTGKNNHDQLSKCSVTEDNGKLHVVFQLSTTDQVSLKFYDSSGKNIYKKSSIRLNDTKEIDIFPAEKYPYTFKIEAKEFIILGNITLE
ncbi:MAG: hypothetical protein IKH69_10485 [Bacteroidaceae bacterium]|nr:hypothetical protein [Bacteroidaceae bacterium]